MDDDSFKKFDEGKRRWTLLDFEALEQVVDVMEMGAKKYGEENWKHCTSIPRCVNALFRHLVAYVNGEMVDQESGKSHMAHVICNAMFILHKENEQKKHTNAPERETKNG